MSARHLSANQLLAQGVPLQAVTNMVGGHVGELAGLAPRRQRPSYRPAPRAPVAYGPPAPTRADRIRSKIAVVARHHGLPVQAILGRRRTRVIVAARQQAMWEVRKAFGLSLPRLGQIFGRHHTTVLHDLRAYEARQA